MVKFGKKQKFYICLSKNSNGQGLRECTEKEDNVTFLNRTECCERFNLVDSDDNIEIIQKIISEVPAHSVIVFDEVPLSSKVKKRKASYDWSQLENKRPEEVTAVVCLQPILIAPTFRAKIHNVIGPKDCHLIELESQYRSTCNIVEFVNQLCREKLSIEYADVKVSPSHDVKGPEVTAISISDQSQVADLRIWLCNQLQQELACKPSQVKMIHVSSTKKLAQDVVRGTVYENSVIPTNEFQGCESQVIVVFLGVDNNNFSEVLEMCSRAQYKLILVVSPDNSLHDEIISTRAEITVHNVPIYNVAATSGRDTNARDFHVIALLTADTVRLKEEQEAKDTAETATEVARLKEEEKTQEAFLDFTNDYGLTPPAIAAEQGNSDADLGEIDQEDNIPLLIDADGGNHPLFSQFLEKWARMRQQQKVRESSKK